MAPGDLLLIPVYRFTYAQPKAGLSKKNRPLRGGKDVGWGLTFCRIGETGFAPVASCSQSKRFLESFCGFAQSVTQL